MKANSEHYNIIAQVLSDQEFAGDPDALGTLDNDLKIRDQELVDGALVDRPLNDIHVSELVLALNLAQGNLAGGTGDYRDDARQL